MNLEGYEYSTGKSLLDFQFYSEGPKGKIKKIVRYIPQNANGITYFNLGFGDWDDKSKKIDDKSVTNNLDRKRILITVAKTLLEFTAYFPDALVYARGSTPSRTRLYQMEVLANLKEIGKILEVFGFINGHWAPFERNVNYEAFLVWRK